MPHSIARHRRSLRPLAAILLLPMLASLPACDRSGGSDAAEPAAATPAGETVTVSLAVEGMHCGGCANAIRQRVAKMEGVSACEVSFEKGEALVTLRSPASPDGIVETITRLGYSVTPRTTPAADASPPAPATEPPADAAG